MYAGLSTIFTVIMFFASKLTLGIVAGAISSISWFTTALYFMATNHTTVEFGYFFVMLAIVCILMTVSGALQALNPYRQEEQGIL